MDLNVEENIDWLMESSATVEQVVSDSKGKELRDNEAQQLERFLRILLEYFENEPITDAGTVNGVVSSDESLQSMLRSLKALGYFYCVRTSRKYAPGGKVMLKRPKFVPASNSPYVVNRQVHYYCSCGREYNEKLRQRLQTSRRINTDCKATLVVRQVSIFKLKIPESRQPRLEAFRNLRKSIAAGEAHFRSELWVSISLPKMHHHLVNPVGHHLDPEVSAAMHSLVSTGDKTKEDIQMELRRIVNQEFTKSHAQPAPNNAAFYPNLKVIYNHLRHYGLVRKRYQRRKKLVSPEKVKEDLKLTISEVLNGVQQCSDVKVLKEISYIMSRVKLKTGSSGVINLGDAQESGNVDNPQDPLIMVPTTSGSTLQ